MLIFENFPTYNNNNNNHNSRVAPQMWAFARSISEFRFQGLGFRVYNTRMAPRMWALTRNISAGRYSIIKYMTKKEKKTR